MKRDLSKEMETLDDLKSQFVTSSWGGKKLPYTFIEPGIYMLATVFKG